MDLHPETKRIAGRKWQQDAVTDWMDATRAADGRYSDFVAAAPGAGKTRFAIATVHEMFRHDLIDMVIVIAPQTMLAIQWATEARTLFDDAGLPRSVEAVCSDTASGALSLAQLRGRMDNGQRPDVMILTYQGLASRMVADMVAQLSLRGTRVLAIFDEIHHAAEESSWGKALLRAFESAAYTLAMSGTPFRGRTYERDEDGEIVAVRSTERIPFLTYTPDGALRGGLPGLTYREATEADVCRVIAFQRVDGMVGWTETETDPESGETDTQERAMMLSEEADEATRARRLAAALAHDGTSHFTHDLLELALDRVGAYREDQIDAALLVVCDSIAHARYTQRLVHKMTGIDAPVVASDDPASRSVIRAFKDGTAPIIISVQMFAEGVDAPRIRVIAYLARRVAPLNFRQIVGRGVRMVADYDFADEGRLIATRQREGYPDPEHQIATMLLPADPALDELAVTIERELGSLVVPPEPPAEPRCPRCGHSPCRPRPGNPCPECDYEPPEREWEATEGAGERDGAIVRGFRVEEATMEIGERIVDEHRDNPIIAGYPPEVVALILQLSGDPHRGDHPDRST
jgi:superfamily II DNA or RNA helicase